MITTLTNVGVTTRGDDNNYASACRKGTYFRGELSHPNNGSPLWLNLTNLGVIPGGTNTDTVAMVTGHVFLAQSPESFTYDADGNLTQDGRWQYTWDAENRLLSMQAISSVPVAAKLKLDFTYDSLGRRIQKLVSAWNESSYVPQSTNYFVYDGWNLTAILNPQQSTTYSFLWGADVSGSMQGAGGIGGLLAVSQISSSQLTNCFVAYDANGNVAGLGNGADGTVAAQYEYGPFGEVIRATGPMAKTNPFLFSTKYQDDETDLLYYGYRYYNARTGRWLTRDPIYQEGGENLLAFYGNDLVDFIDPSGDKINSIILYSTGSSQIAADGVGSWSTSLDYPYRWMGSDDNLGFECGYGYNWPSVFNPIPHARGRKRVCALYKWEAVAEWQIPCDNRSPKWELTADNIVLKEIGVTGKESILESIAGPMWDGPTGRLDGNYIRSPVGSVLRQYAWDSPRYNVPPGKGKGYYFSGEFELRITDSENSRAVKFWISFYWDDEISGSQVGQLTILQSDHEVAH